MAPHRPPSSTSRFCSSLTLVGAVVLALAQQQGVKSDLDLPAPYPKPFFLREWEEDDLRDFKWSDALRNSLKRNKDGDDELGNDPLQYFSEEQVNAAMKAEYKVVPHPVVYTSQILREGVNCSSIRMNLHRNHVKPELQLRPDWIHKSDFIGDCPAHYVTKELPPMYSPAVILEAVCTCGGSQCSRSGHQCVPVSRHVPVWVRRGPNFHVLDVEEVTVACACVRRPSGEGNFVFAAAVQN
uniref:Crustacean female sex hormone 2 n=1 Tax=Lysmata vittata TaxID=749979 RepID=A0A7L7YYC3_9EUCA|nr:crustacean female sex hormone 2 [Lysmata vittata]